MGWKGSPVKGGPAGLTAALVLSLHGPLLDLSSAWPQTQADIHSRHVD